ncbi:MAG: 5-formyltetrahydrofolate cyclo-ligase [Alphaproteobacteria bacterium]|nr:5-formyltetrahydrofolate cyclo-ligase [Alphaproteobacteria bacterium]
MRIEAKRHRAFIDPAAENVDSATALFYEKISPSKDQVIAGYWPIEREFDAALILDHLDQEGFSCCLPIVQKDTREMKFAPWTKTSDMEKGAFDVLQPIVKDEGSWVEPDIVLVPLLAFDRRGYRLGYGGGYYDATLKALRARKTIIAVGVAYAQQACLFNLPTDEHDEKLDWVITPQEAHSFG